MKTPEEMAEEYCREWWGNYLVADYLKSAVKAVFLGGYQAAKDETNLPTSAKWISVKDRLPEEGLENQIVLVWRASWHDYDTVRWKSYNFDDVNSETITHWMPLPEPPEKVK